jgi:hypothetical protein
MRRLDVEEQRTRHRVFTRAIVSTEGSCRTWWRPAACRCCSRRTPGRTRRCPRGWRRCAPASRCSRRRCRHAGRADLEAGLFGVVFVHAHFHHRFHGAGGFAAGTRTFSSKTSRVPCLVPGMKAAISCAGRSGSRPTTWCSGWRPSRRRRQVGASALNQSDGVNSKDGPLMSEANTMPS